tara:strand:- start:163 stop:270 length:108 start_codon:yes stop_codon:yes gene_type:complete
MTKKFMQNKKKVPKTKKAENNTEWLDKVINQLIKK